MKTRLRLAHLRLVSSVLLTALIGGCTTIGGHGNPAAGASCAGAGFSHTASAGRDGAGYQTILSDFFATASTALLLSSSAGLGLSLGKSLGLGLAASLIEPSRSDDEGPARMPAAAGPAFQPMTQAQLEAYMRASLQQAGYQALVNLGMPRQAIDQGLRYKTLYDQHEDGGQILVNAQKGCLQLITADGSGSCVLNLRPQAPAAHLEQAAPLFADANGGVYFAPGQMGL